MRNAARLAVNVASIKTINNQYAATKTLPDKAYHKKLACLKLIHKIKVTSIYSGIINAYVRAWILTFGHSPPPCGVRLVNANQILSPSVKSRAPSGYASL